MRFLKNSKPLLYWGNGGVKSDRKCTFLKMIENHCDNQSFGKRITALRKPYKTCWLWRLRDAFYENCRKRMPKSITFITISCCVLAQLPIITFPVRKLQFEEVQKRKRQILINTVVYEDFWRPFRQNFEFWGQNHGLLQCLAMWFRSVPNHYFFLGKTQILRMKFM